MKRPKLGPYVIGSAIIWAATIFGASQRMGVFEARSDVMSLLGIGAVLHLILVWGPLVAASKKLEELRGEWPADRCHVSLCEFALPNVTM